MVRVPFLLSMILEFPTRQYLSGMDSPKKASGLDLNQKILFWTLLHKEFEFERKRSNSNFQVKCEYQTTTNIAFFCKMVRVPFLLSMILEFLTRQYLSGMDSPKKASGLDLDKKELENFYIKILNVKRKRSKSNFQVKCEYQTTTNLAFLCKMGRVSFLLCVILKLIRHQKVPFRYWFAKKGSGLDLDKKNLFWRLLHKELELEKKLSNYNFQVKSKYPTTTNIAFSWKMVRVLFLLSMIWEFPTRKYLSGIGSPKKARVLIWTKKTFFEDFYIKSLNWKRKRSNSNFQVKSKYQTTTNIAFSWKMVRVPFLLSMIWEFPTRKYLSGIDSPKKARSGLDLDKKHLFWRLLHKEFELEKKTVKFQFSG